MYGIFFHNLKLEFRLHVSFDILEEITQLDKNSSINLI